MKLIYSNQTITVVFNDGTIYLTKCEKETAERISKMSDDNKEEIFMILFPEESKMLEEKKEAEKFNEDLSKIAESDDFYSEDSRLYLKGIPLSIPTELAEKIMSCINNEDYEELERWKKFWSWASLIPHPESRESLFPFIKRQDIQITDEGEMITYRRVYKKNSDQDISLVEFVTREYLRIKQNKKNPSRDVYRDKDTGEYSLKPTEGCSVVGNLKEMASNLSSLEENVFTDAHTGKETYRIGEESRMDYSQADWNVREECSKGYHSSGIAFKYSHFGNIPIVCIVNPADVVACPEDGYKLRSVAFTPIMILNEDCETHNDKEMLNVIKSTFKTRLTNVTNKVTSVEYKEWLNGHSLFKDIPNVDIDSIIKRIDLNVKPVDRIIK